MTVSPETLLAFVEGELSPEEARKVATEVANDPSLMAHVENHRALKVRLQEAALAPEGMAPPQAAEPMMLTEPAAGMPRADFVPRQAASFVPAGAMGVGIVLGALLWSSLAPSADIRTEGGTVIAGGTLSRALSMVIAKDRNGNAFAPVAIGESFFSSDGLFCRNFMTGQPQRGGLAGIACQEDGAWAIRVLARAEAPPSAASGKEPPPPEAVREMLRVLMVGGPLDADGEQAARAQRWLVQ
jgi:hypothetical protein